MRVASLSGCTRMPSLRFARGVSIGETVPRDGLARATVAGCPELRVWVCGRTVLFLCSLPDRAFPIPLRPPLFCGVLFPVTTGGLTGVRVLGVTVTVSRRGCSAGLFAPWPRLAPIPGLDGSRTVGAVAGLLSPELRGRAATLGGFAGSCGRTTPKAPPIVSTRSGLTARAVWRGSSRIRTWGTFVFTALAIAPTSGPRFTTSRPREP